jgi:hypothetical protein
VPRPKFVDCLDFIGVDQLLEILVDVIHLYPQMDAGKTLVICVQWNHACDHALEVLGVFVSDGLIGINGSKDII